MSLVGGYKILDFKRKPVEYGGDDAVEIDGIYEAIEGNYDKALLVSGLSVVYDNGDDTTTQVDYPDFFANFALTNSGYKSTIEIEPVEATETKYSGATEKILIVGKEGTIEFFAVGSNEYGQDDKPTK